MARFSAELPMPRLYVSIAGSRHPPLIYLALKFLRLIQVLGSLGQAVVCKRVMEPVCRVWGSQAVGKEQCVAL